VSKSLKSRNRKISLRLAHYVQACGEIVEDFRDVLVEHTAKLQQEATARGGNTGPDHIKEAAALHRLRVGCDNFLNVLMGNY
jgi:hypothetical protein